MKKLLFVFVLSITSLGCIGQEVTVHNVHIDSAWITSTDSVIEGTGWTLSVDTSRWYYVRPKDTLIQDPNNPYLWFNEATYMGLDSTQYYYQVWNLSNMLGDYIDFQKHDTARVSESWSITKEPNLYDFYKWLLNKRK